MQFEEHRLVCKTDKIRFFLGDKVLRVGEELVDHNNNGNKFYVNPKPDMRVNGSFIEYEYKGNRCRLRVENATLAFTAPTLIEITPTSVDEVIHLYPETCR